MKFGKVIRLEANLAWNDRYVDYFLDYKGLKQLLKSHIKADDKIHDMTAFFEEFKPRWKRELLKVETFLKREIVGLCERIDDLSKKEASPERHEVLVRRNFAFKRLSKFCEINHEGMKKFIKKVVKHTDDAFVDDLTRLRVMSDKVDVARTKHSVALDECKTKLEEIANSDDTPLEFDEHAASELMNQVEIEDDVPIVRELILESLPPGKVTQLKLGIQMDEMGEWIAVPVLIAKGKFEGPVLGLTSALHGNELNGIPLIFRLFREIDVDTMSGTLIAIPVLNPPGYQRRQRGFHDSQDLNRLFPGKKDGNCGQVYAHNVVEKVIKKLDYHIDLHTASFGRVNSLYVRADMLNPLTHMMAMLQRPQIIVHNTAPDGSMRSAAMALQIPSITVEIGDPLQFHNHFVGRSLSGVENVLSWLNMQSFDDDEGSTTAEGHRPMSPRRSAASRRSVSSTADDEKTTVCSRSFWIYSKHGGVLRVKPSVNTWVEKDQVIAYVQDLFGKIVCTYRAPADGIIVGKSTNPICSTGDRIVHLGVVEAKFPKKADDGHT
mmetsp:Transcript_25639/g.72586  ORF Transcript_25639/g.72586 Transcript_25639/m.72586 type:complete len:549 (-) Transcript_25639:398-2044(-)